MVLPLSKAWPLRLQEHKTLNKHLVPPWPHLPEGTTRVSDLEVCAPLGLYPLVFIGMDGIGLQVSRAQHERMTSLVTTSVM